MELNIDNNVSLAYDDGSHPDSPYYRGKEEEVTYDDSLKAMKKRAKAREEFKKFVEKRMELRKQSLINNLNSL